MKEAFRTFVREEVQKYPLFQLTTDPTTRTKLQDAIAREVQTKLIEKQTFPFDSTVSSSAAFCRPRASSNKPRKRSFRNNARSRWSNFRRPKKRARRRKNNAASPTGPIGNPWADGARICRPAAYRSAERNRPAFAVGSDRNHGSGKVRHQPAPNRGGEISPGVSGVIRLDSIWRTERWNRAAGLHLSWQCYSAFDNGCHLSLGVDLGLNHISYLHLPAHFRRQ